MKALFSRIDRFRLLALVLWAVPFVALLPLGVLWLWQWEAMRYWLLSILLFSAAGYGLQFWLHRKERQGLMDAQTLPDPTWSPGADDAWVLVEDLASKIDPEKWPLTEARSITLLGEQTLERVARHFNPEVAQPLFELTLPHTLLIIERASRDLRRIITDHIPFSHRLTFGALLRAYRWKPFAERLLALFRSGQWVINPAHALLSEGARQLQGQHLNLARVEIQGWLLREYVRKVGYYGIELYSGRLALSEDEPLARPTAASAPDLQQVGIEETLPGEPLRILVLGRSNVGRSSLINALFGQLRVAVDLLPGTTKMLTPYRLEREGLDLALIYDSPGVDTMDEQTLREAGAEADMILWVSAADRPDRQGDREALDSLRAFFGERMTRRAPPLLVVLSHIDHLRPVREWLPPYDLAEPKTLKAESIRAAVEVVAMDLAVPIGHLIPVCLAAGRTYNVDDALWAAILDALDAAQRSRLLRCQDAQRRDENWSLVRRQLANAGRFLLALPERGGLGRAHK